MVTIGCANNKGGVGKTSSSYNLAMFLVKKYNYKVLVCDNDQQRNITDIFFGMSREKYDRGSMADIYLSNPKVEDLIYKTDIDGLYFIPAHDRLNQAEREIANFSGNNQILKRWIAVNKDELIEDYSIDIIIIDCAPHKGLVNQNAYEASDTILVIVSPSQQAMAGLRAFKEKLARPRREKRAVILINALEEDNEEHMYIYDTLKDKSFPFASNVLKPIIPRHRKVESSVFGDCIPIVDFQEEEFEKEKNPYKGYVDVIKELIKRGVIHEE